MTNQDVEIYYPEESIKAKFEAGELEHVRRHLFDFVQRHNEEIRKVFPQAPKEDFEYIHWIEEKVSRLGSVHLPSEMAEQIREINKEIWYRGEEGNEEDRQSIKESWSQRYSMKWRQARKLEILFLVNQYSKELISLIKESTKA